VFYNIFGQPGHLHIVQLCRVNNFSSSVHPAGLNRAVPWPTLFLLVYSPGLFRAPLTFPTLKKEAALSFEAPACFFVLKDSGRNINCNSWVVSDCSISLSAFDSNHLYDVSSFTSSPIHGSSK